MNARRVARGMLAVIFLGAGALHFVAPDFFLRIVPPWVPHARLAVMVSGAAEIAGAIGLLVPRTRQVAAWGLAALLLAVFPANIYMLQQARADGAPPWFEASLWARLPMQALLIWSVLWVRR